MSEEKQKTSTMVVGIATTLNKPEIGKGAYSPGLQFDAQLYYDVIRDIVGRNLVENISPFIIDKFAKDLSDVAKCKIIICFEDLGNGAFVSEMRKCKARGLIVVFVPNLEVIDRANKWYATLFDNLDLVDVLVAKMDNMKKLLKSFIVKYMPKKKITENTSTLPARGEHFNLLRGKIVNGIKIICIHHTTPTPYDIKNTNNKMSLDANNLFYDEQKRKNIIHFAGASYFKNTYECCKAGIDTIKKYPELGKFILKITQWPKGKFSLDVMSRGEKEYDKIMKLCKENEDVVQLYDTNFISDEEKAQLYSSCRLAICCSGSEGFGHYIVEAAFYGCLVVTTDGVPMKSILKNEDTFALARHEKIIALGCGVKYIVPSANICEAIDKLDIMRYDKERIQQCEDNFIQIQNAFLRDMKQFIAWVTEDSPIKNTNEDTDEEKILGNKEEKEEKGEEKYNCKVVYPAGFQPKSAYAYVFLIMKGDKYTPGIFMAAYSLVRTNTKHDILCMVTADVSERARKAISVICPVVEVPYITHEVQRLRTEKQQQLYESWADVAFTKWSCLLLTKYKKVMFVDADTVLIHNMDDVFELPAPSGTFSNPWARPYAKDGKGIENHYGKIHHGDTIPLGILERALHSNSFVAVGTTITLEPSLEDYIGFMNSISCKKPFGFTKCNSMVDEKSISNYYLERGIMWTHVHQIYNYIPWMTKWLDADLDIKMKKISGVPRIFHFFGNKPWNLAREAWPDLESWWNLVYILLRDENYLEEDRALLKTYIDSENLEKEIPKKCFWCLLRGGRDATSHNIFEENDDGIILSCPLLKL